MSRMRETAALGVELWNDSCAPSELAQAVAAGMVGATSNPVIVGAAVSADKAKWLPVVDALIRDNPSASEDDVTWMLIAALVKEGAATLRPTWEKSEGATGFLSAQVSPKHWRSAERMLAHGVELAALAPNIAIKAPAIPSGIEAMEELTAKGINVNATVSFSVSQAVAVAEALERGVRRAISGGFERRRLHPYITIMIGRIDDHIKRCLEKDKLAIDPGHANWAGIAVFKEARKVFRERGFTSTLLAAAYRHHLHWTQLVGPGVVQSIPYGWWKSFDASDVVPTARLDEPVAKEILAALGSKVPDFRRAFDVDGMRPADFVGYGATVHTLKQFLDGYDKLVQLVRERMLP